MESSEEQSLSLETNNQGPKTKVRHYNSEPLVNSCDDSIAAERSLSLPTANSTPTTMRRLTYSQSFRSIKEQKIHKNIVADSPYNNAAILDKLFGKVDLKQQLQEILSTFELCFLFRQFLEKQRCVENLDFYVEVELLKKQVCILSTSFNSIRNMRILN